MSHTNSDQSPISLYSRELQEALQKRDAFFAALSGKALQDALDFQEEIDAALNGAGNTHNRLAVLQNMMRAQMQQLRENSLHLVDNLKLLQKKMDALAASSSKI